MTPQYLKSHKPPQIDESGFDNIISISVQASAILVEIPLSVFLFYRELLFTSRAEEIAVLREFSDALVRNLFPKSLWGHEVHRCALNEIVATKGKKAFTSLLLKETNSSKLLYVAL